MAGTAFSNNSHSGFSSASSFGGFGDPNQQALNQLYRRIQELEQLIHKNQGSMNAVSSELKKSYDENTKKMAADFKKSYEKFSSDCLHTYNENISILNNDYNKKVSALQHQYEQLKQETAKMEKELIEKYNELEKKTNNLCERDTAYRKQAQVAITKLESRIADTKKNLPVECFFPHKIEIYSDELVRSRELYDRELYSIAFAAANGAHIGLERLRNDTKREFERLMSLVNRYSCLLKAAEDFAASDTVHTFRSSEQETIRMDDYALGYWSDGTFDVIMKEMELHHENINVISGENAVESLKFRKEEEISSFFNEQIENVKHLPEIIYLTAEYACKAYVESERRKKTLSLAIKRMNVQNFILKSLKYGPCRAPQTKSFWRFFGEQLISHKCTDPIELPDIREEMRLVFTREYSCSKNEDEFIVTIMPVRKGTDIITRTTCEFKGDKSDTDLIKLLTEIFAPFSAITVPYGTNRAPDPQKVFTRTEAEQLAAQRVFS